MMPQATREKSDYAETFRAHAAERAGAGEPSWVASLRERALARFEERGFPAADEEEWKYTNVAPIARGGFLPAVGGGAARPTREDVERLAYEEARRSRLVFVNGVIDERLTSHQALPPNVVVADLAEAAAGKHGGLVRDRLGALAGERGGPFSDLNTAFFGGAFVHVPPGVKTEAPVELIFLSTVGGGHRLTSPRVLVVAERESELALIESYGAAGHGAYFTNAVVELFVADNARVTHTKVQDENGEAFHVASTFADLGRDSFYDATAVTLGARLSRHDIHVRLDCEGAECYVDGLYVVGDGQHADTHSLIDHLRPDCASRQTYKGILDGKSRAVFNGKVFVHEGARGTDARQSNKNLLLSRDARVDTKPQLEIYNDDVKCAHGATVGQLGEEELFYLLSRGLRPALARNLLTYGFAEEVVAKIKHESIRRQLDEAILNRLHVRLEA